MDDGADQLTVAAALPATAVGAAGADGTVKGIQAVEVVDQVPAPTALTPANWNTKLEPLARPDTVTGDAPETAGPQVEPPFDDIRYRYDVTGMPPLSAITPAFHDSTVAVFVSAHTGAEVGAAGALGGAAEPGDDHGDEPIVFNART